MNKRKQAMEKAKRAESAIKGPPAELKTKSNWVSSKEAQSGIPKYLRRDYKK